MKNIFTFSICAQMQVLSDGKKLLDSSSFK